MEETTYLNTVLDSDKNIEKTLFDSIKVGVLEHQLNFCSIYIFFYYIGIEKIRFIFKLVLATLVYIASLNSHRNISILRERRALFSARIPEGPSGVSNRD